MQEFGTLTTTADVIDALGGNQEVSELTRADAKAVFNWRGSKFPAWTYLSIKSGLRAKGKTAPDSLWKMEPPLSKKRRAAAEAQ